MPRRSVHESSDVRERGPSLTLTERQLLILGHVGDGLSNKAIAYELGISPNGGHGLMKLPGLGRSQAFDGTVGVSTGGHTIAGLP